MDQYAQRITRDYPVRRKAQEKENMRTYLMGQLRALGYDAKLNDCGKAVNVIAGDPERASILYAAHYDTPLREPLPAILCPTRPVTYLLYQALTPVLALVLCFAVSLGVTFALSLPNLTLPLFLVLLIGALAYTFFQDVPAFRRMMRFVIVTYTAATVVYFIYPTQQLLRPEAFARDNALTRAVAWFYTFDTNTKRLPVAPRHWLRRGAVRAAGRPAAPETGVVAGGVRASGAVHQPFHGFHEAALDPRCAVRASGVRAGMADVLRTAGAARLRSQERGTRHGRQLFFADQSALGG